MQLLPSSLAGYLAEMPCRWLYEVEKENSKYGENRPLRREKGCYVELGIDQEVKSYFLMW